LEHSKPSAVNDADLGRLSSLLRESAAGLSVFLTDQQLKRFRLYHQELTFWNSRVNLVASSGSATDIFVKHFLDSLNHTISNQLPTGERNRRNSI